MNKEKKSTRVAFVEALESLMDEDPRVVMVSADSVAVFRATHLLEKYPDRIVEVGIAEQNAVMTAAGLASAGMIPFVCTYAGFSVMRACEQMRTFVAYPELNVKFFGANSGVFSGEREGVTHQFFEDLGILRTVAGFTVIAPADANQTKKAVRASRDIPGPVYVRIGSGRDPVVYPDEALAPFTPGRADVLVRRGDNVLILGCGHILSNALEAADVLTGLGVGVTLVNVSTIKPLDKETLLPLIERCDRLITVEDHNVIGGLGSAVCEMVCDTSPRLVVRLGLGDRYPESGGAAELLDRYGMGVQDIVDAAMKERDSP
jgi:transketolase